MFARGTLVTALALYVLLGASGARAVHKGTEPTYVGLSGTCTQVHSGSDSWGHCNGVVVFDNGFPLVCFGLNKLPKEKGKYLYVLLFKNGPTKPGSSGISVSNHANGGRHEESIAIALGAKEVKIALQAGLDEKTQALKDPVIEVGGTRVKGDGPRVFLVDLTKKEVTYRPVKVSLPTEVPDMGDTDQKTWPAAMLGAVEQLRKDSSEVNKFLGP